MTKREIEGEIKSQIERLLIISRESIGTLEKHTKEMQKSDPFVIAPPEEILRICNCIQKINELNNSLIDRDIL